MSTQSPEVAALTAAWIVVKYLVFAGTTEGGLPWRTMFTSAADAPVAVAANATAKSAIAPARPLAGTQSLNDISAVSSPWMERREAIPKEAPGLVRQRFRTAPDPLANEVHCRWPRVHPRRAQ